MRTLLVAALALAACRSSSSPAQPQPPSSGSAAQVELAAFVPADTAVAVFFERAMLDHPMMGMGLDEPRRELAAAAARPRTTPAERFWGLIAEELAPLDDGALRKVGWRPGESEVVAYTVGLVPVLRARVDGKTLRALVDRASQASGIKPVEGTWKGTPYLVFTPEADEAKIVIAHSDDQVVMAVAVQHEAVLDHLTRFAPPPGHDSLAATWSIADAADRFMYLAPSRLGALIADPAELRILAGDDADDEDATCLAAVGGFIATLPRITSTVASSEQRFAMQVVADVSAEVAAMLRGAPVPGWPDDGKRQVPTMRIGIGAPPYPLAVRAIRVLEDMMTAGEACGKDGDSFGVARMVSELAPLQIVQGATWEVAVFDGVEVTMTLALAVRDVPALWTMLASALPMLGKTVPAIGEVREVPGPFPIRIGVGRERMVGSIGAGADARVRDYLDAAPGPRAPFLSRIDQTMMIGFRDGSFRFFGEPMKDDDPDDNAPILGDVTIEARVENHQLIIDTSIHKDR